MAVRTVLLGEALLMFTAVRAIFFAFTAGHRNAVGLFIVMQENRNPGELLVLHISGLIVDPAHIDNDSAALFQRTIGSVLKIRLLVNVGPAGVGLVPGNDLIASFRILQRCRHVQFCRAVPAAKH